MAQFNKEKIAREALKLATKGQLERAIHEYERILEYEPDDERTLKKVADLHIRKQDLRTGVDRLRQVAGLYAKKGFYLKAVAVYKQVLQYDPDNVEYFEKLGELYSHINMFSEVRRNFNLAFEHHRRRGDLRKQVEVLRKVVHINPYDQITRLKLGELYFSIGNLTEGRAEYTSVLAILREEGRDEEYLKVLERMLDRIPDDRELLASLVVFCREKRQEERALARVHRYLNDSPEDREMLEWFGDLLMAVNELDKAGKIYRRAAELASEQNDQAATRRLTRKAAGPDGAGLEIEPEADQAPAGRSPAAAPAAEPETDDDDRDWIALRERTLGEATIFGKYGLYEKALTKLYDLSERRPEDTLVLNRIRELHTARNQPGAAAAFSAAKGLVFLAKGKPEQVRRAVEEMAELLPGDSRIEQLRRDLDGMDFNRVATALTVIRDTYAPAAMPAAPAPPPPPPPAAAEPEEEAILVDDVVPEIEDEIIIDADEFEPAPAAAGRMETAPPLEDELEEADFFAAQGIYPEARDAYAAILARNPRLEAVRRKLAEVERRLAEAEAATVQPRPATGAEEDLSGFIEELEEGDRQQRQREEQRLAESIRAFRASISAQVSPEDFDSHYNLGIAYLEMDLHSEAVQEFRQCLRGEERDGEIYTLIAKCSIMQGNEAEAAMFLRMAIDTMQQKDVGALLLTAAQSFERIGRNDLALRFYKRLQVSDPGNRSAVMRARDLSKAGVAAAEDGGEIERALEEYLT